MTRPNTHDTDSYKASHFMQLPDGTTEMFNYMEGRKGGKYPVSVWFGLQFILEKMSRPVTVQDVDRARAFFIKHGEPFPYEGWMHIVNVHGGYLPLEIRALPEGAVVPLGVPWMTTRNTDPKVPWLTGYTETRRERVWYPTNVATISWHAKAVIMKHLLKTADDPWNEIQFKLHDFGSRGVSSEESAEIGGAAHLVNFQGSDTVVGVMAANELYGIEMAAYSIPASEHGTIIAWGKAREDESYANILMKFAKPGSVVACVSDAYDLMHAVEYIWGGRLRQRVIDSGATIVIRPDSGNPVQIVPDVLDILADKFGTTTNTKGYRVLNHTRVLNGDGNDDEKPIDDVLNAVEARGFSATNVAFGMGGGLLQKHDRDTQRVADKTSNVVVNGVDTPVCKEPKTDMSKRSKAGRLDVRGIHPHSYETVYGARSVDSAMNTVFYNGEIMRLESMFGVRMLAEAALRTHLGL